MVALRDQHWAVAHAIYEITGYRIDGQPITTMDRYLQLPEGTILGKLVWAVNCTKCGADCESRCVTPSGRLARRPHKDRIVGCVAVTLAIADEPVITEEPDLLDVLTGG